MDKIKNMLNTYMICGAILESLKGVDGMPESTVYVALNSNYDLSTKVIGMLTRQGAIKVSGHYITKGDKFDAIFKNCIDGERTIKELLTKIYLGAL